MSTHPAPTPVGPWLADLLRRELDLGSAPLHDGTRLVDDLLIDSLALVELAMVIEDELRIGLGDTTVAELATFGDLCAAVNARLLGRVPASG